MPSFSVGGDAITADEDGEDEEDDKGDFGLLSVPLTLAETSGVCLGSGPLAGAAMATTGSLPVSFIYVISAAVAVRILRLSLAA